MSLRDPDRSPLGEVKLKTCGNLFRISLLKRFWCAWDSSPLERPYVGKLMLHKRLRRRQPPVAEQEGVRIGIHPDDPPVPVLAGVPRCVFGNFDGYVRALEIADSPNIGVCLCCGTWLEGGPLMGKSVVEAIRYFAAQRKLFKIHFRNVNAPLPHFVETFVDDGYMDMYQVMKTLAEVRFDGIAIPDHVPLMAGDPKAGYAYTVGYMKSLLARAQAETS